MSGRLGPASVCLYTCPVCGPTSLSALPGVVGSEGAQRGGLRDPLFFLPPCRRSRGHHSIETRPGLFLDLPGRLAWPH